MLNPEVLRCHEDLITLATYMYNKEKQWIIIFTLCENINIFGYMGARGGGGGGGGMGASTIISWGGGLQQ